jgi:GAF domain-containing protein
MFVNYRSSHRFPSDEIATIELFANQAAVAIRNFQLYEEVTRRVDALEALYEAGKAVTGTLALNEILCRIAEQAWRFTGHYGKQARFSHLALKEGNRLRFEAAYPPEHLLGLQRVVGDIDLEHDKCIGITGRAAETGQSKLVGDVTQDPDYTEYDPEIHSELAVPIKLGEEVIGVINVEHPDHNAFDEEDRQVLESLAGQAAIAIQNAQQYEELRRTKGLVGTRTALAWMGMASSAWRHTIDKHTVTIQDQLQLLRQDLERVSSPPEGTKMSERIAMIERLFAQILEKPITPPLSREAGLERVSLTTLVGERARQLWQNAPYNKAKLQLDLQLPESATVWANPEWLRRAFDMLVDNAVNAVAGSGVQRITIGTQAADGRAEILISDTGPGIPEEMQAKIGLERIEKPEDAEGLGMGLLIAQIIVQTYGGDICVESTGSTGTAMVIWLPLKR